MNETSEQQGRRVACYMAAAAQVLGGVDGSRDAFMERVQLMVGGSAPNFPTLIHWGDHVRQHGRPILHFSPSDEPTVPVIALVAQVDGRKHIVENCMLWTGRDDDRARLIPDNFAFGEFVFGSDMRLRHSKRAAVRDFERALPGMRRAYERLLDLEVEQRRRGDALPLPSLLRAAA